MFKKAAAFMACISVCLIGLISSAGCSGNTGMDFSEEETTHFAEPDLVRHVVGETFDSEYFKFTYISVEKVDSLDGGKYKPAKGMEFYQLKLTMENLTDEEKHVNYNCFIGFADDVMIDQFYFTEDVIKGNLSGAGDSVTGTLTYSVPEGAKKVEVIFQYDMFHEEKMAFTVK